MPDNVNGRGGEFLNRSISGIWVTVGASMMLALAGVINGCAAFSLWQKQPQPIPVYQVQPPPQAQQSAPPPPQPVTTTPPPSHAP
jgi:hypothetical protein